MFFDSHCHLTAPQLAPNFLNILERAKASGVTQFLNIGDDLNSSVAAREQCLQAQNFGVQMWSTAGVHPQHALQWNDEAAQKVRNLAKFPEVRAIGEIGLDFVYDETHPEFPGASREVQENCLREQLQIARELNLPVVLHNREADASLLQVVADFPDVRGVFHCFGSSPEVAAQVLELGFYLGFTGLVTFKNAGEVRAAAKLCPLEKLLIETDAPYLAPVPNRGKTNEPSYLPQIAQTLAELHEISVEDLAAITTFNARELFGLN